MSASSTVARVVLQHPFFASYFSSISSLHLSSLRKRSREKDIQDRSNSKSTVYRHSSPCLHESDSASPLVHLARPCLHARRATAVQSSKSWTTRVSVQPGGGDHVPRSIKAADCRVNLQSQGDNLWQGQKKVISPGTIDCNLDVYCMPYHHPLLNNMFVRVPTSSIMRLDTVAILCGFVAPGCLGYKIINIVS